MDRNVDLVPVRLLGGLALDLAGNWGSIAVIPSFAIPNQREGLFTANFIGISMPARDLLVVSLKNEVIVRCDGANVIFTNLLNLALAVGSPQVEDLSLLGVLNFVVGALEDNGELAKLRVSRVTGLFRLVRARARLSGLAFDGEGDGRRSRVSPAFAIEVVGERHGLGFLTADHAMTVAIERGITIGRANSNVAGVATVGGGHDIAYVIRASYGRSGFVRVLVVGGAVNDNNTGELAILVFDIFSAGLLRGRIY